jgi:hypothetical protein
MSFANPTPLHIGTTGTLGGRRYRVAGRVVMGMDDGGEKYYWNEFNLVGDGDDSVTLVYEETEAGGEWKLFTLFEPESPISMQEATSKRVGDMVNLDGTERPVTLADESRVYHIEGEAPEGVEVGDVARYFNAETGDKMLVASWTGDEIEFFWGADLPRGTVAAAFGVREEAVQRSVSNFAGSLLGSQDEETPASGGVVKLVGVFLALAIAFAAFYSCKPGRSRAVVVRTAAPPAPLVIGSEGKLGGKTWRVRGHVVMEIAQVGRLHDRHEYVLSDDDGGRALLVCGLKPGDANWILFTSLEPSAPLTPVQAAALRVGNEVNVDGWVGRVSRLFQAVIRQAESSDVSSMEIGAVLFGLDAASGSTPLLIRWNDRGILFYRGETLPAKSAVAAFSRKVGT